MLGDKGQYKCNEGFSYNILTGKCEDDDERSNLSESKYIKGWKYIDNLTINAVSTPFLA